MNWIKELNYKWMFYGLGIIFLMNNNMEFIQSKINDISWTRNETQLQTLSYPIVAHMVMGHHYKDEHMLELIHP
jgi:hypothetical protein